PLSNHQVVLNNGATLDNAGTIASTAYYAVKSDTGSATVINASDASITTSAGGGQAVAFFDGIGSVINEGQIKGPQYAILMSAGGTVENNGGTLEALGSTGTNETSSVLIQGAKGTVINRNGGLIQAGDAGVGLADGGKVVSQGQGSII